MKVVLGRGSFRCVNLAFKEMIQSLFDVSEFHGGYFIFFW